MRKKTYRAQPEPSERLITTGEASNHCQISQPALRRWIKDGQLRAVRTPGKHARIEVGEFQRFLKRHGMRPYPRTDAPERPRVLVVEDDPDVLRVLTEMLAIDRSGPVIETAVDGYDALIKVGTFKPSFLILDVVMPKLDGIEVCRRLRASPETRGIKILAVTGRSDVVENVLAAGADACVTKPFDFDRLGAELARFLSSSERADLTPAGPRS